MLLKPNRARGKKEVIDAQVRQAWRNDIRLCQAIECYREFSKLTRDEQVARIFEYIDGKHDAVPNVNALILRAAEVYWEVTGRSPRTVGTGADTGPLLGENPFIALLTNLFEEEGLKSPTRYMITKVLRKKSVKKVVSNMHARG